jgi:L,D-transpeptidase catalytic domain
MIDFSIRVARPIGIAILLLIVTAQITSTTALAKVVAKVDKSSQTMRISINGRHAYTWRVSTGRGRFRTPSGNHRPYLLRRMHYSSKYNGSPMPHSIFFRGGYAIHGTSQTRLLGRRASHGCVRLHPSNAARLFSLVRRYGMKNTRVVINSRLRAPRASQRPMRSTKLKRYAGKGRNCSFWRRKCRANWGNNKSNFIGCLRHEGC